MYILVSFNSLGAEGIYSVYTLFILTLLVRRAYTVYIHCLF